MRLFLAALLLFVVIGVSAQPSKPATADLILVNGKVWTGDSAAVFAEAVAISGNMILQTGSTATIRQLAGPSTRIIDLGGKLVTPGINDAHIHFLSGSMGLSAIDLNECKTLPQALSIIGAFVRSHPEKKWITGMGWQYGIFPGSLPNKAALDSISPDRPVYIRAYDGHSAWVNSKALQLANVTKDTKYEGFGSIVKDTNGEPTGCLTEGAMALVNTIIPKPTTEEKLQALRMGLDYARSHGITSIQNANGSVEEFALYEQLLKNGELTVRTSVAFSVGSKTTEKDIQDFITVKNRIGDNPMIRAAAVKFMLDGVIESHTAVMLAPYADGEDGGRPANGTFALPLELYRNLVARFDKEGFQVYTHAIGDRSVREALNAYENAQRVNGTSGKRHRIEHIEQSAPEDLPRFTQLGVLPSMQPIHADPGTVDVWGKAVGKEREPHSFVWASMLQQKARLVFSSDWPACMTPDPVRGLHNAVNRRTIEGEPPGGWVPEQRVSLLDALIAYTQGGAYASFEEERKGRIKPGHLADIIVFDINLFELPAMSIGTSKVVMTVFDGKIIYTDESIR